jgi:hypothetical protein
MEFLYDFDPPLALGSNDVLEFKRDGLVLVNGHRLTTSTRLPMSKPCTAGHDFTCPQGMALEIDPYDPTGACEDLPKIPARRYRCQDCDHEEPI